MGDTAIPATGWTMRWTESPDTPLTKCSWPAIGWSVVRYMHLLHCTSNAQSREYLEEFLIETSGRAWLSFVRAIESDSADSIGLCGIALSRGSNRGRLGIWSNPNCGSRYCLGSRTESVADRLGRNEAPPASCQLHPGNPASSRVVSSLA